MYMFGYNMYIHCVCCVSFQLQSLRESDAQKKEADEKFNEYLKVCHFHFFLNLNIFLSLLLAPRMAV